MPSPARIQLRMSRIRLSLPLVLAASATTVAVAGAATAVGLGAAAFFAVQALRRKPVPANHRPQPVVVVTGGSRGLGLAIASRYAREGAKLVLAARNRAELEQAQAKLLAEHPNMHPEDFHLVDVDLSEPSACEHLILEAVRRFSRIDVLVNNAGIIEVGPLEAQPVEAFERAMRINFFAALYTTYAALPHMMAQLPVRGRRASIVNIASLGGKIAVPHMLPYSAAKFALVGFSEGLHAELRGNGVRVTTVCPGLMRTGGEDHAIFVGNIDKEKRWFRLAATTPGLSVSAAYAANRIYSAVRCGRAEITISPQAWLAARFVGFAPETTQCINALVNDWVLPKTPSSLALL